MSKLTEALHHIPGANLVVDFDDDKPAPVSHVEAPPANHGYQPQQPQPASYQPNAYTPAVGVVGVSTVDPNNDAYQRLLAKTDFKTSKASVVIEGCLALLANIPMDDRLKFKAAVAQAGAQGITADVILSTFDQLKQALQDEGEKFAKFIQSQLDKEVTGRQNQIQQLTAQAQQIQAQINQLNEDSFAAQQKIQGAQHTFDTAFTARSAELDNEKATKANLLS
jgi:outer membrane murein-binding lipoprotein Lpp